MSGPVLSERDRETLLTIVRTHIATGAPVPSSEVARRQGSVSAATVRAVMGRLERAGLLKQPHTSAGRVPTLQAFEYFAREVAQRARLSRSDRSRIDGLIRPEGKNVEELLDRVPQALSEFCHGLGLLAVQPFSETIIEELRFVPLSGRRVVVVVTQSGLVRDKVVRTTESYDVEELERMTAYLNRHFRGWSLNAMRGEMERRVRSEQSRFLEQAFRLCVHSLDAARGDDSLRLDGLANLLEQSDAPDPETVRELLHALEEKQRLALFLEECVQERDDPVRVVVGLEALSPVLTPYTLIGKAYGRPHRTLGWLGFLGPARMDYARAITAVSYVADVVGREMARN